MGLNTGSSFLDIFHFDVGRREESPKLSFDEQRGRYFHSGSSLECVDELLDITEA